MPLPVLAIIAAMIQDVAGTLVGQDFGAWSRADIERIAGAAGWSIRENQHSLIIETGGPARARSTKVSYGQEDYGYGEQTDLQITETCAADELAPLHAATLAAVVAVLGPPAMVGGPHAWAFWRNPRVRLERDIRRPSVTLRVEPAEPAEAQEYSDAEWSPDWQPTDLWNAEPDVNSDACKSLLGMMSYDARMADTWDEFETSLRELFASLSADLPLLLDYVPHVGWEISEADGDHMVAGSFNSDGVHVHSVVYNTTQSTDYPSLPLEPDSGARVAEIAIDTIRGWGHASPVRLRHQCFVTGPVRLSAKSGFRLA
ncbi:hypothetical protein EV385_6633 [Krasilnikovia cinnamomea]|uniref:Uncharacterized protein n=1 Tax=Krasilnikovia cinnamomea TaxID=349313 RepID=A0A4Q7Z9V1_9ACTN|nr:hypothetical protein [Krasilnikovia cinnamomea]RZU46559.1 hypothetical protein EV385_6633 [Krasilnikovia cinnamomea]